MFGNLSLGFGFGRGRSSVVLNFTDGLPGSMALTRDSVQWIVNSSGILTELASGAYGVHHTPAGVPLGYLAEAEKTNDALYSHLYNASPWSTQRMTLTLANGTGPDGLTTAARLIETTGTANTHSATQNFPHAADVPELGSAYVKGIGDERAFGIRANHSTEVKYIDLETGLAADAADPPDAFWIENLGNDWHRLSIQTVNGTATTPIAWAFRGAKIVAGVPTPTYVGDVLKGFYIWGVEHSTAAYPTSPVISGAEAATREACRMAGSFPFRTPLSIRIAGRSAKGIGATDQHFCAVTEAGYGRIVQVYRQSSDRHLIVDDGVNDPIDLGTLTDDTDFDETVSIAPGGPLHLIEVGTDYTGIAKHWDGSVKLIELL